MPSPRNRWNIPLLLCLYTALAVAWGWRLHSHEASNEAPDEAIQQTRVMIAQRIAKLPPHRLRPALFELGMLPEADMLALADWLAQVPMLRLRQVTIQQGPVHTPCPLNDALVLSHVGFAGVREMTPAGASLFGRVWASAAVTLVGLTPLKAR